ncbi:MAG: OPT/YSL family transporter [Burkholderiaceae bacterium]
MSLAEGASGNTVHRPVGDGAQVQPRWRWLPPIGSRRYHALLLAVGILILGPLGGITSAYMNFSLGFFVGGQVLAGILGSAITLGYGAQGKHGANFMQTTAASAANMASLGVLVQAMVWLGLPQPPVIPLVAYLLCAGMFGAGVGMLYTSILVDRLQLTYPSGLAVANILRALTDRVLLRRSIGQLGSGVLVGLGGGLGAANIGWLGATGLSTSTLGAGLIVGARIGIPPFIAGLLFTALMPYFRSIGWLGPHDPFRKISFLIALGMLLGAAVVDLSLVFASALKRLNTTRAAPRPPVVPAEEAWKQTNTRRLLAWVVFWGIAIVVVGSRFLDQPWGYMSFAVVMVFIFALVNGISLGVSDQNPISSAFVVTVILMASFGLKSPIVGLLAAAVVLVGAGVAGDMQQDRSTGWRLGTDRTLQFRYQAAGILMGAILAVAFAKLFMAAYPVLNLDQTVLSEADQPKHWTAAMTYKLVGTLRSLTDDKPYQRTAIGIGLGIGLLIAFLRQLIKSRERYRRFVASGRRGFAVDFVLDSLILPSPYAFAFGGFVNLATSSWFAVGSVLSSAINTLSLRSAAKGLEGDQSLPADMSGTSLWGGGLIAGDALAALGLGIFGLMATLFA